ncbi:hypothetical protein [Halalkalibacter flavus]
MNVISDEISSISFSSLSLHFINNPNVPIEVPENQTSIHYGAVAESNK